MSQTCSYLRKGKKGIFKQKECDKCSAVGTNVPDVRVIKYCEGDFFACEIFRQEASKEDSLK